MRRKPAYVTTYLKYNSPK